VRCRGGGGSTFATAFFIIVPRYRFGGIGRSRGCREWRTFEREAYGLDRGDRPASPGFDDGADVGPLACPGEGRGGDAGILRRLGR